MFLCTYIKHCGCSSGGKAAHPLITGWIVQSPLPSSTCQCVLGQVKLWINVAIYQTTFLFVFMFVLKHFYEGSLKVVWSDPRHQLP